MIILDTNVLSALMRPRPDEVVVRWLDGQAAESVWTTAVTVFELWAGITLLEDQARKVALTASMDELLVGVLDGRVLPFDDAAARHGGELTAQRQRAGRIAEIRDVQIAGICMARNATVATRNIRHFHWPGVRVVNPWDADSE